MTTIKQLIESKNFDWVNPNITEENFPLTVVRSNEYKLYHFNRYISSEDAVKEIENDGYVPATISELLEWKDWNGKDLVVALGSVGRVDGSRRVPCLGGGGSGRDLCLTWWGGVWGSGFRFLVVRNSSSETEKIGTRTCDTLNLESAIKTVKNNLVNL